MTQADGPETADLYLDLVGRTLLHELRPDHGMRILRLAEEVLTAQGRPVTEANVQAVLARLFEPAQGAETRFESANWYAKIAAEPFTMGSPERLANVRQAVETVLSEDVPGDLVEAGVWRGGLCIMMKAVLAAAGARRRLYVCDSFQGLPEAAEGPDAAINSLHENPLLAVGAEEVRANFERFGLLDDDVVLVEGWFADTMP